MKIPGYSNWFTVFRPLRWLVPLAEQAYDVAGIFLAADTPLPDETVRLLQRIAGELGEQTDLLRALLDDGRGHGKDVGQRAEWPSGADISSCSTSPSRTSAHAPVLHSPKPEDAAEGPPPIAPDSVSGGGHPKTEDIVDEYWDEAYAPFVERRAAENARLRRELDAARQERDDANARANAGRLAP